MNAINLSSKQLRQLLKIKSQIERLQNKLRKFYGEPARVERKKRRKISAAGRARIAAAQKARWARVKGKKK